MKLRTGNDQVVLVRPAAVASVANYRSAKSDTIMKNMSEVTLINGEKFLAEGHFSDLFNALVKEEIALANGDLNA